MNRREMIVSALRVGGVAYVAPMILASVTPAAAQVTFGCQGRACANLVVGCNSNSSCVCILLHNGTGFCLFGATPCNSGPLCGTGNTCPEGFVCAINSCCNGGAPTCAPLSGWCAFDVTAPQRGDGPTFDGRG